MNRSEEQLGKMAKDQENCQVESQRTNPDGSIPMVAMPNMISVCDCGMCITTALGILFCGTDVKINAKNTEIKSKDFEIQALKKSIVDAKSKIVAVLASKGNELNAKDSEINFKNIEINAKGSEINAKNSEIHELSDTNAKFEHHKELLAGRVFHSDPRNESLKSLLTLEIDKLYLKYEKSTKTSDDQKKIEELAETLADVKTKLHLQMEQRQIYEKEHEEMFKVLNIPADGNRHFTDILRTINVLVEQIETDRYAHAESVLDSYSRKGDRTNS